MAARCLNVLIFTTTLWLPDACHLTYYYINGSKLPNVYRLFDIVIYLKLYAEQFLPHM